ncbi:hypothetical protein EDB81DRAFT_900739 [Dactylonectria macrodidyma]|uniref:Uncharacterized protein n=1 Tax=Dactylonectria macrodidyma TaxID=307937 RepID=A0A9P9EP84_9HYPO|nr:hypothetical protein EDB81DRAFT_900739 [Dactylonectria macrodidyma]
MFAKLATVDGNSLTPTELSLLRSSSSNYCSSPSPTRPSSIFALIPLPIEPRVKTTKTTTSATISSKIANMANAASSSTDMVLAMNDPYMQQIIDGTETYEFRKYNMPGVERIWFYRTAPHSAITHVCEVDAAATRNTGDARLPEDGLGNKEYNGQTC